VQILEDRELWQRMSETAMKRVRRFFNYDDMIASYRGIYEQYREMPDVDPGPVVPLEPAAAG